MTQITDRFISVISFYLLHTSYEPNIPFGTTSTGYKSKQIRQLPQIFYCNASWKVWFELQAEYPRFGNVYFRFYLGVRWSDGALSRALWWISLSESREQILHLPFLPTLTLRLSPFFTDTLRWLTLADAYVVWVLL